MLTWCLSVTSMFHLSSPIKSVIPFSACSRSCKHTPPTKRIIQAAQATPLLISSDVPGHYPSFYLSSFSLFLWPLFLVAVSCLYEKHTSKNGFLRGHCFASPFLLNDLCHGSVGDSLSNDTSLVYNRPILF